MIAAHEAVGAGFGSLNIGLGAVGGNSAAVIAIALGVVDLANTSLPEERAIGITEVGVQAASGSVIAVVKVFRFDEQCLVAALERPNGEVP